MAGRYFVYDSFNVLPLSPRTLKKSTHSLVVGRLAISRRLLPKPIKTGVSAEDSPITMEPNIVLKRKYKIVLGTNNSSRFIPDYCQLITKSFRCDGIGNVPKKLLSSISFRVYDEVSHGMDKYDLKWWLWLLQDGSWLLADAEKTALFERVQPK